MKKSITMIIGSASVAALGIFIVLAQAHAIFVPFFTPTRIELQGLKDQYPVNGLMSYIISLKGYGSNCVAFEAGIFRQDSSLPKGEERVAYYNQIQDCRKIEISQGPYNYTKSFTYAGKTVFGNSGNYQVRVNVLDQITTQNYHETRSFTVVEESS